MILIKNFLKIDNKKFRSVWSFQQENIFIMSIITKPNR